MANKLIINNPHTTMSSSPLLSPATHLLTIAAETRRRKVSRWAMIVRKMKQEPDHSPLTKTLQDLNGLLWCWSVTIKIKQEIIDSDSLPMIISLISSRDKTEAWWAMGCIHVFMLDCEMEKNGKDIRGEINKSYVALCVEHGVIPKLIERIGFSKDSSVSQRAINILVTISEYSEYKRDCIPAIPKLIKTLSSQRCGYESEKSSHVLINILNGGREYITLFIESGGIPALNEAVDKIPRWSNGGIINLFKITLSSFDTKDHI
jgi:hypothetical protein